MSSRTLQETWVRSWLELYYVMIPSARNLGQVMVGTLLCHDTLCKKPGSGHG